MVDLSHAFVWAKGGFAVFGYCRVGSVCIQVTVCVDDLYLVVTRHRAIDAPFRSACYTGYSTGPTGISCSIGY